MHLCLAVECSTSSLHVLQHCLSVLLPIQSNLPITPAPRLPGEQRPHPPSHIKSPKRPLRRRKDAEKLAVAHPARKNITRNNLTQGPVAIVPTQQLGPHEPDQRKIFSTHPPELPRMISPFSKMFACLLLLISTAPLNSLSWSCLTHTSICALIARCMTLAVV